MNGRNKNAERENNFVDVKYKRIPFFWFQEKCLNHDIVYDESLLTWKSMLPTKDVSKFIKSTL